MCGIAGFIGSWPDGSLDRALDALAPRGPDGCAATRRDEILFGSTRLAIMDPAGGGQPFSDQAGRFILHGTGEIYNADELREELRHLGHPFRTRCDLEVIPHAWAVWGPACLPRFNGMFAFALWDTQEFALHLARDPCGQKPLVWHHSGGRFAFASETRALTAAGLETTFRPPALKAFLALRYLPEPHTPWQEIEHLPAGHHLVLRPGTAPICREIPSPDFPISADAAQIGQLADDAVRLASRTDVPAVLYLSGGVDSWMLAHANRKFGTASHAITLDFPGKLGEGDAAARIAAATGLTHHRIPWDHRELARLPDLVERLESPVGDPLIVAFDLLAAAAKDAGAKVALSGEGPDEWFGGYGFHRAASWAGRLYALAGGRIFPVLAGLVDHAGPLADAAAGLRQNLGRDGRQRIRTWLENWPAATAEERANGLRRLFTAAEIDALRLTASPSDLADIEPFPLATSDLALLPRAIDAQSRAWLPSWAIGRHEKIALARGVEVRMPFLDPRLAAHQQLGDLGKTHWRRAARLAGWSRSRTPKQAFALPAAELVASPAFRELAAGFLDPHSIRQRGWFHPHAVATIETRALTGSFLAAKQWGALLILEIWARRYL